jgi:phosphoserine phosphatase RsbX
VGAEAIGASGSLIEWAVASRALAGEARSGDGHVVETYPGGALVGAVDGLGHGDEAATAAEAATAILSRHRSEPVVSLMQRCHEGLRSTRGAVMSIASLDGSDHTMSWLGVGNVEASLVRATAEPGPRRESLILRGGVVGFQLPRLLPSTVSVRAGDVLVFTTDGIDIPSFDVVRISDPPQRIAQDILARFARDTDDALALVVRYRGEQS